MMRSRQKYLFLFFVAFICVALAAPTEATFYAVKSLYIDGNFVGSSTSSLGLIYSFDRITLASEGTRWNMYNTLNGALDEFSIYSGVLDANAVWDHYHAALAGEPNYTAEVASDSPLIYLRFEDATTGGGDTAANTGGSVGRGGTYISDVNVVAGIFGTDQAALIGGNDDKGCIDIDDMDRAFSLDDISIEVWVKSGNLDDSNPRLFQHNGNYRNKLAYGVQTDANDSGVMQAGVIGGGSTDFFDVQTTYDINDNQWHQVVVTYDTTFDPCGYPNQVEADNPLVWFKFEEEIGQDVNVVNHGSLSVDANYIGPDPIFAPGKVGKGVFLTGKGDTAAEAIAIFAQNYDSGIGDYSHSYAITPGDMTVEVWFRTRPDAEYKESGPHGWARMFSNNGTWSNLNSARAHITGGDYAMVCGADEGEEDNVLYLLDPAYDADAPEPNSTGPGDGDWHHMVYVYDINEPGNDPCIVMQLYLDGALLGQDAVEPNVTTTANAVMGPEFKEFLIGAEAASNGMYNALRGTIDEFAIYGYLLPEERIAEHYKEGWEAESWKPETCAQIYIYGWNKPADKNSDCYVNFLDIVAMGNDWWRCVEPGDGSCEKPWLE